MAPVDVRPVRVTDLRKALDIVLNLTLRRIEYAQGLCIQEGFKNSRRALLLYIMGVSAPVGLDRTRVNIVIILNMDFRKAGFAQKMCLQKVFNFFWMTLLSLLV
jgi:hypothetical protein